MYVNAKQTLCLIKRSVKQFIYKIDLNDRKRILLFFLIRLNKNYIKN
jgi:hypothetical protein